MKWTHVSVVTEKRQKQLDADPVIVMFEKEDGLWNSPDGLTAASRWLNKNGKRRGVLVLGGPEYSQTRPE